MAREPYADLAPYYDELGKDPAVETFYGEWRRALVEALARYRIRLRVLVDIACGTGNTTVPWARLRGVRVVGVDRSEAMLRVARTKSSAVRWYCQELSKLVIPERADAVTCHFDALNHVLRDAELQRVFHRVARVLREGGLFQFDLNTRHILRWLGGRQKLFRVGRHWYMADNAFDPRTDTAEFRQLWFVARGSLFRRMEVTVRERAYDDRALRRMLRRAGMELVEVRVQRTVAGRPGRKLYLAIRRPAPALREVAGKRRRQSLRSPRPCRGAARPTPAPARRISNRRS